MSMAEKAAFSEFGGNQLRLPVVESIRVEGYPLYPGTVDVQGLHHDVLDGVNVVVGVNGQGKTTFLNTLLRCILGPFEQSKADLKNPGRGQHELTKLKNVGYFGAKIGERADRAAVTLTIRFGEHVVRLKRSLGPKLQILELACDGVIKHDADESMWSELAKELSGIATEYDFNFVIRNFVFFLEDKVPLLWSPLGQFEILRILFLPADLAGRCSSLHDKILIADSGFRNRLWRMNERLTEIREVRHALGAQEEASVEEIELAIGALQTRIAEQIKLVLDLRDNEKDLLAELETGEAKVFELTLGLDASRTGLHLLESSYFLRSMPYATETARLLYSDLMAGKPCLVCGTEDHSAAKRLSDLIRKGRCPACESDLKTGDETLVDLGIERIKRAEQEVAQLYGQYQIASDQLDQLREELNLCRNQLEGARRIELELQLKLNRVSDRLGATTGVPTLLVEANQIRDELKLDRQRLQDLRAQYDKALTEAGDIVRAIGEAVCNKFQEYANKFILEEVALKYEAHLRTLGQSGQRLAFPSFVIEMSSRLNSDKTERTEANQVSESQREFLDLAFRMALFDVAVNHNGAGMLVIETPEASLDAVHIATAGRMLRHFAATVRGNKVIATTNLNGENMMGWLLGTAEKTTPPPGIEDFVINLLRDGVPTVAYRDNPDTYDKLFRRGLCGGA